MGSGYLAAQNLSECAECVGRIDTGFCKGIWKWELHAGMTKSNRRSFDCAGAKSCDHFARDDRLLVMRASRLRRLGPVHTTRAVAPGANFFEFKE